MTILEGPPISPGKLGNDLPVGEAALAVFSAAMQHLEDKGKNLLIYSR